MAIVFNAPQDQYGLQTAGSALAQALMQNATERNQFSNTLQRDLLLNQLQQQNNFQNQSQQSILQSQFGPLLGNALSVAYDPNTSIQQKNSALAEYIAAGGKVSDVSNAYKALSEQTQIDQVSNLLNPIQVNRNTSVTTADVNGNPMVDVNRQATVQNGNFYETIDDNTAFELASSPNKNIAAIGKAAIESKKLSQSRFEADRKYEAAQANPYLKQIDDQRQALRNKELAANNLQIALEEGKTGGFSIDNISRIFGRPELLSQSGAQLLSSVKELLVSNIGRVGARPNQWIEQQIASALPDLGKSKIANQTLASAIQGEIQLARERINLTDQLAEKDRQQYGYVKGDIASRVDKALDPIAKKIELDTAYKMRELFEQETGANTLRKRLMTKVPFGTPLTRNNYLLFKQKYNGDSSQAIDNAKKLGYTIFTSDDVVGAQ